MRDKRALRKVLRMEEELHRRKKLLRRKNLVHHKMVRRRTRLELLRWMVQQMHTTRARTLQRTMLGPRKSRWVLWRRRSLLCRLVQMGLSRQIQTGWGRERFQIGEGMVAMGSLRILLPMEILLDPHHRVLLRMLG